MRLITLFLITVPLMAQLTTIADTIYSPWSTTAPWAGRIEVKAACAMSYAGINYGRGSRIYAAMVTGSINIALVPNLAATVSGCYNNENVYTVDFTPSSGGTRWSERWAVPVSGTALTIGQVRDPYPILPYGRQSANLVFAGPSSGSSMFPGFRSLVTSDLPNSGVAAGTYGSSSCIPVTTINIKGVVTASTCATPSGGAWGSITGTLSSQTDLQSALNLKANAADSVLTGNPTAPTAAAADDDTSVATTAHVKDAIELATIAGTGAGDAYKTMSLSSDGLTPRLKLFSEMPPMVFDNGSSTLTASCVVREALAGGTFTGVHLLSIDSATGADISGSVTVQFSTSPSTGSTTWTTIGTVALSSASRVADTTLSGWTATVAADRLVRACITGTPTSAQKLIVSPRFF